MIHPVVIVPVYNSCKTVESVLNTVKRYVSSIIVINDGSTDGTGELLRSVDGIDLIELKKNTGKGAALKEGFLRALESGFTHAIVFDADGQYPAEQITFFLQRIHDDPNALWVGQCTPSFRRSDLQHLCSNLRNLLINLWFQLCTGSSIKDARCGFRAYPLDFINRIKHKTGNRYEFEVEILILADWYNAPVKSVGVKTCFPAKGNYVSHLRPVRDLLQIFKSIAVHLVPTEPDSRRFSWANLVRCVKNIISREMKANATPFKASVSIAAGVFLALTPFHGFQVILLLIAAVVFKLNRPLALLGVNISPAPLLPFWFAAAAATGKLLVPEWFISKFESYLLSFSDSFIMRLLSLNRIGVLHTISQYFLGSFILAAFCAALIFLLSWVLFRWRKTVIDQ